MLVNFRDYHVLRGVRLVSGIAHYLITTIVVFHPIYKKLHFILELSSQHYATPFKNLHPMWKICTSLPQRELEFKVD